MTARKPCMGDLSPKFCGHFWRGLSQVIWASPSLAARKLIYNSFYYHHQTLSPSLASYNFRKAAFKLIGMEGGHVLDMRTYQRVETHW
jgi:hypothetical protein